MLYWGAYYLTEKSSWGVKSVMVSVLPVYRRNATSITVWIQKRRIRVAWVWNREGTEKLVNVKQNSICFIPTGMKARTTWKHTPQFLVGISEKWPYHLPSIQNLEIFCQIVSTPGVCIYSLVKQSQVVCGHYHHFCSFFEVIQRRNSCMTGLFSLIFQTCSLIKPRTFLLCHHWFPQNDFLETSTEIP